MVSLEDSKSVETAEQVVEIKEVEFQETWHMMESVGLEPLDGFFNELVPILSDLKKAQNEIQVKTEQFIRITEVDLLKNHTIYDAVMSMIYCLVASNGNKNEPRKSSCLCCCPSSYYNYYHYFAGRPLISYSSLSNENALINQSWCELTSVLSSTSLELDPEGFRTAAKICEQLRIDYGEVSFNTDTFNRNMQKLQVASKSAVETRSLVNQIQQSFSQMLNKIDMYKDIHPIATRAKETKQFTPSQIILRYWPDQSRVLGKVSQRVRRINVVPPPVHERPSSKPSVDEESKQVSEESFTCLECLVCLSIAEDAVELSCCSTIMCETCSTQLSSICPSCRMSFAAKPSIPIRRLIGSFAWRCTCGYSTTRSETKSHLESCPKRLKCKFKDCVFLGDKADLKAHVYSAHVDDIMAEYC
jgi:hypothetical protein